MPEFVFGRAPEPLVEPGVGRVLEVAPESAAKGAPDVLPMGRDAPWLAPLAGYSDLPFRLLCREYGAAVGCTEMVSAKGLMYKSLGTWPLLATCPADRPLVVQLFGDDPDFLLRAAAELVERGYEWFDLNAGCAVPKVTKTGAGAALVRDEESLGRLAAMVRAVGGVAGPGRVGVKFRLGWDRDWSLDLARRLEDAGAGWLCLHPRTARQGFEGQARWEALARLREAVALPLLASGDLWDAEAGVACLDQTGVDGLMFARGALRRPSIFREFTALARGGDAPELDAAGLLALARRHMELSRQFGNECTAFLKMRTFVPRYLKGQPHVGDLRRRVVSCSSWEELDETLEEALGHLPPGRDDCVGDHCGDHDDGHEDGLDGRNNKDETK